MTLDFLLDLYLRPVVGCGCTRTRFALSPILHARVEYLYDFWSLSIHVLAVPSRRPPLPHKVELFENFVFF